MARMDIDTYFMSIAELVKKRSTCIKQHVGAVLVKGAYNINRLQWKPKRTSHCSEETCLRQTLGSLEKSHLCRGVHAEQNTIIKLQYMVFQQKIQQFIQHISHVCLARKY